MKSEIQNAMRLKMGSIQLEIHRTARAAGEAAAQAAARELRRLAQPGGNFGVIFATGASQMDTLGALTSTPDLPWAQVLGFHMDEYVGLDSDHPASFRRYMRERLTGKVAMRSFFEMDGNPDGIESFAEKYARSLRDANPQLCLLGIGENGHLAFNDPAEADFDDPLPIKVVTLDQACRQQQVSEGWFATLEEVPQQALTLTIPTLLRVPKLILTVPGSRKAAAVRRTLHGPVSTDCPATILRTHPDVTIYLDMDSAAELSDLDLSQQ
jgi:glucosamine-6-phosphate deaminase